jgi:uncharacterized protein (DUF1697 family)
MPKYIAFLRAINVGGHTVKMDELRSIFRASGFENVETFIASGNVIFDSKSKEPGTLERKIETALQKSLGYEVVTFVRATSELQRIADHNAFTAAECSKGKAIYVGFVANKPSQQVARQLMSCQSDVDKLHLKDREIYWLCFGNFRESKLSGTQLEKTLGVRTTIRNLNTVRKLAEKYT